MFCSNKIVLFENAGIPNFLNLTTLMHVIHYLAHFVSSSGERYNQKMWIDNLICLLERLIMLLVQIIRLV